MDKNFGRLPVLQTERLLLRRLTFDDAEDVFAYASDPEVTRYLMWLPHQSIADSLTFITTALERYKTGLTAPWAIVLTAENKVIGTCDYIHWWPDHGRAEIGYALSRDYWGRGLMTEAVKEIIAYGFEVKGVNRIQAMCEIANIGSARVMEKAGMSFEGILREYMMQHDQLRDMKLYAILGKDLEG